jgi:hypothetical protein
MYEKRILIKFCCHLVLVDNYFLPSAIVLLGHDQLNQDINGHENESVAREDEGGRGPFDYWSGQRRMRQHGGQGISGHDNHGSEKNAQIKATIAFGHAISGRASPRNHYREWS